MKSRETYKKLKETDSYLIIQYKKIQNLNLNKKSLFSFKFGVKIILLSKIQFNINNKEILRNSGSEKIQKCDFEFDYERIGYDEIPKTEILDMKSCRLSKASFKISDEFKIELIKKYKYLFQKPHIFQKNRLFVNIFPYSHDSQKNVMKKLFFGRILSLEFLEKEKQGHFILNEAENSKVQRYVFKPEKINILKILNSHFEKNYRFQKFDIFDFMKENRFFYEKEIREKDDPKLDFENYFSLRDDNIYTFDLNTPSQTVKKSSTHKKKK